MMIQHYIKISVRNLLKYKTQSIISIIGLAIGFTCFALSGLWIHYEISYDAFHPDAEQIYITGEKSKTSNTGYSGISSVLLANYLVEQFPEIEHACFICTTVKTIGKETLKCLEIDSAFYSILPITLVTGNLQFLHNSKEVAITEKASKRIFGNKSPLGEQTPEGETIVAVIRDWEGHSNFEYDILAPREDKDPQWYINYGKTVLKIKKEVDITALQHKLLKIEVMTNDRPYKIPVIITPITEIHYKHPDMATTVQLSHIRLFNLISLLVVLSALSNYLIMHLIRMRMRQQELMLRKVNGASNKKLITLLVSELTLLLILALLSGLFLMEVTLPEFKTLSQIDQNGAYFYKKSIFYFIGGIGGTFLFATFAIIWQRRRININILSGKQLSSAFRKIGLWFQLAVSIGFIFCTIVMMKQLHYLRSTETTGIAHLNTGIIKDIYEVETETEATGYDKILYQIPSIQIEGKINIPFDIQGKTTYSIGNWDEKKEDASYIHADRFMLTREAFNIFGLTLTQGRFPEGDKSNVLINESLAKALGWNDAVGKKFEEYIVTGVLKDIQLSPLTPVFPAYYINEEEQDSRLYTFSYHESLKEAEKEIYKYMSKESPNLILYTTSPEKLLDEALTSENALMQLLTAASMVCILTAIFGIFSLVSLSCEQRRKEIAIRKVNGATIPDILSFFIKEYVILLILSALTTFPIGYFLMKQWLEGYIKQVEINIWIYISIFIGITFIVFLCVGWKVWKTARLNPADVIKSE